MIKLGVFDHMDVSGVSTQQQFEDRLRITEAYDQNGFYGYHVAEHHFTPLGIAASPSVFLAAVAQRTKNLRFGPLVYLLPFYHPLRVLEEVCMLDQMSGGRFELGVGRGVSPFEAKFYNVDHTKSAEQYHEAFQVLMKGMQEKTLNFSGEFYDFENVPMLLEPVQQPHPPLWYGASNPNGVEWPAANDVNIISLGRREKVKTIVRNYLQARLDHGKPLDNGPLMGVSRHVVVAPTDDEALDIARRAYPKWRESFRWLWDYMGEDVEKMIWVVQGNYPDTFDELMEIGNGIAGSPETVRDFIQEEVRETGVNYFCSWLAFGDLTPEESIRSTELLAQATATIEPISAASLLENV